MATLKPCRVCKKELASDYMGGCPGCGTEDPIGNRGKKRKREHILGILLSLAVMIAILVALSKFGYLEPVAGAIGDVIERLG